MDEENRNDDCTNNYCRERTATSELNHAKEGPGFLRTKLGLLLPLLLLLLLLLMMFAMLGYTWMGTDGDTVLRTSLGNAVGGGDLGVGSQEVNALDKVSGIRDGDIGAVRSSGTGVQSTEQLRRRRRHRRKRQSSREEDADKDANHRSESDDDNNNDDDDDDDDGDISRPIHSDSSSSTEDTTTKLADFKRRINSATSFDEIRDIIIQTGAHLKDDEAIFPPSISSTTTTSSSSSSSSITTTSSSSSSSSSSPIRQQQTTPRATSADLSSRSRGSPGAKSSSKTTTTTKKTTKRAKLKQLLKVVQANTTCGRRSATIVGQFGLGRSQGPTIELTVCGPKFTTDDPTSTLPSDVWMYNLTDRAEEHTEWMERIKKESICRPMEMILNLEPKQSTDRRHRPVKAIISVKKCRLLYISPDNEQNVTCFAVKKRTRLIPIQYEDEGQIRTYIVSDHLECSATTNRSAVAARKVKTKAADRNTTTKVNSKKKKIKSCPWPFKKVSQTRCKCDKATDGSPGYFRYLTCRNIQKGKRKLQKAQAQCVRKCRCLEPNCDKGKVFDVKLRLCSRTFTGKSYADRCSRARKPYT